MSSATQEDPNMSDNPAADPFVFNGIDGASGGYVTRALSPQDIATLAQGKPLASPQAPPAAAPLISSQETHGQVFSSCSEAGRSLWSHEPCCPHRNESS